MGATETSWDLNLSLPPIKNTLIRNIPCKRAYIWRTILYLRGLGLFTNAILREFLRALCIGLTLDLKYGPWLRMCVSRTGLRGFRIGAHAGTILLMIEILHDLSYHCLPNFQELW